MTFIADSQNFNIIQSICLKHGIPRMKGKDWIFSDGKVGKQIWIDTRTPGKDHPECCLVGIHMGAELGVQEDGHGYTETTNMIRNDILEALAKAKPKVPVSEDKLKNPAPDTSTLGLIKTPDPKPEVLEGVVTPEQKKSDICPGCTLPVKQCKGIFKKCVNYKGAPAPKEQITNGDEKMNEVKEPEILSKGEIMPVPALRTNTTPQKLTVEDIKKYICPKASDSEAYYFLQLCLARDLNPFLKEAYLIKYGDTPATMIVGKDAFTRKAEESGKLDGFEAGIIVSKNDGEGFITREGTLLLKGEELLGGWARIHRKDMSKPFEVRVSMIEYNKGKNNWATMPATMIRKVALVQALREAFTKELGGCYEGSEVGEDSK